jgi:DNA-binding MarR family transcriptional regulator
MLMVGRHSDPRVKVEMSLAARLLRSSLVETEELTSGSTLVCGYLESLIGYHLRRAQDAMHRDFLNTLVELGISQKQAATLVLTSTNLGVSQIEVANALDMDRPTMTAIIDRLEERGLLQRKQSATDRRKRHLYLTPKGEKLMSAMKTKIGEHERRFKKRFNKSELTTLVKYLRRFYEG